MLEASTGLPQRTRTHVSTCTCMHTQIHMHARARARWNEASPSPCHPARLSRGPRSSASSPPRSVGGLAGVTERGGSSGTRPQAPRKERDAVGAPPTPTLRSAQAQCCSGLPVPQARTHSSLRGLKDRRCPHFTDGKPRQERPGPWAETPVCSCGAGPGSLQVRGDCRHPSSRRAGRGRGIS